MKTQKIIWLSAVVVLIAAAIAAAVYYGGKKPEPVPAISETPKTVSETPKTPEIVLPLDKALSRVTKKPFGIYITPQNSPVSPEKFTGYHTGADFEIFSGEENKNISIFAICTGKLLIKEFGRGYGGMAVESCDINGQPVTIVYGHLKLTSVKWTTGDYINAGDVLGILGKGNSVETDYERKHLHLGIHIGTKIDTRGYVATKTELKNWLDPLLVLK